jgi:hypothetical protein
LNVSICSTILCNISNGSIYYKLCFLKICSDGHNHNRDGHNHSSNGHNPKPYHFPATPHRRPLLLCIVRVCHHHTPSSACASKPVPHSSFTATPGNSAIRLAFTTTPGNRAVRPAFTAMPRNQCRDHAPPLPAPPLPLGRHVPELFHLQQFGKPSPSLFPRQLKFARII